MRNKKVGIPLLFVNDEQIGKALSEIRNSDEIELNQAAHWAMNIGDQNMADTLYTQLKNMETQGRELTRGLKFRRERRRGAENCYQEVLNLSGREKEEIIQQARNTSIEFIGGIGDHIEELSRIIPWIKENKESICFSSTRNRINQLARFTPDFEWKENCKNSVTSKGFLAALGTGIPKPQSFKNVLDRNKEYEQEKGILLCMTAAGDSDKLSRWSRSFNLDEAIGLINNLEEYNYKTLT